MIQRRHRLLRRVFDCLAGWDRVDALSLLEVGCGNGQWLVEFQLFGLQPNKLAGLEKDASRAESAQRRIPTADIRFGDAEKLPWEDASFDIVFQSTMFTSILDAEKRKLIAEEMKRVCRPTGAILWYDFMYDNPQNPGVKGIGSKEVGALFFPWSCQFSTVTLAPPLARRIVPVSWLLAEALETFCPFLRTHLLCMARANDTQMSESVANQRRVEQ